MKSYEILKNDYVIGARRGKKNSVDALKAQIKWDGHAKSKWRVIGGDLYAVTPDDIYIISENKGDS